MSDLFPCLCFGSLMVSLAVLISISIRLESRRQAFINYLQESDRSIVCLRPLYETASFRLWQVNGQKDFFWRKGYMVIKPDEIAFYMYTWRKNFDEQESFRFATDEVRWFGRPQKYHPGYNELWIYADTKNGWYRVQIQFARVTMQDVIRALKGVLDDDLVTAYRRRRPYIHIGPISAQPAEQDIYGAWTLQPPLDIFLTPLDVVLFQQQKVQRIIPLKDVQHIKALRRLDAPGQHGLVQFDYGGEKLAFAMKSYESFAELLATAAKRTLEEPLQRKRKKQDYDDLFDDEDE